MRMQYTMYEYKNGAVTCAWDTVRESAHATLASTHPRNVRVERARGVRFYFLNNKACLRVAPFIHTLECAVFCRCSLRTERQPPGLVEFA